MGADELPTTEPKPDVRGHEHRLRPEANDHVAILLRVAGAGPQRPGGTSRAPRATRAREGRRKTTTVATTLFYEVIDPRGQAQRDGRTVTLDMPSRFALHDRMREYLQSEITKRQDELKALEARVAVVRVELGILHDVLAHTVDEPTERRAPAAESSDRAVSDQHAETATLAAKADDRGGGKRAPSSITTGKRLSKKWAVVRDEAVRRYPGSIKNDEVGAVQRKHSLQPSSAANIRSHFYGGVQAGLYERVAYATYRATEKAAEVAGFPLGGDSPRESRDPVARFEKEEEPDDHTPSGSSSLHVGAA